VTVEPHPQRLAAQAAAVDLAGADRAALAVERDAARRFEVVQLGAPSRADQYREQVDQILAEARREHDKLFRLATGRAKRALARYSESISEAEALAAEDARRAADARIVEALEAEAIVSHTLASLWVKADGMSAHGTQPVRRTLRRVLRGLRALAARMLRHLSEAALMVGGSRHCPGRTLSARPRVPRGPARAGRHPSSSRGDLVLAV
jgi:hypothetical protein